MRLSIHTYTAQNNIQLKEIFASYEFIWNQMLFNIYCYNSLVNFVLSFLRRKKSNAICDIKKLPIQKRKYNKILKQSTRLGFHLVLSVRNLDYYVERKIERFSWFKRNVHRLHWDIEAVTLNK